MNLRTSLLGLLFLIGFVPARAQIQVSLEARREWPFYIRHESVVATVKITNLSGRDLLLSDAEAPWFSFQITQGGAENLISPRNPDYKLSPLEIKIGETLKRQVNLNELYPLSEYGPYKIRAAIFSKELGKFFTSPAVNIEMSEGRLIWQQTVGVPETMPNAGGNHRMQLLTLQSAQHVYLYCRVEDPETGAVLCCYRLGHTIDNTKPQVQLDTTNTLHVLHLIGPKTYLLSQIGVNGEFQGRFNYVAPKTKPLLRRDATGRIEIAGASRVETTPTAAAAAAAATGAKLSDRPPGLPIK